MEKLTLNVLLEGKSSFAYLVSQRDKLSGKVNYQISKNIKPYNDEIEAYDEARKAIVKNMLILMKMENLLLSEIIMMCQMKNSKILKEKSKN